MLTLLATVFLGLLLAVASTADLRERRLPNAITAALAVSGMIWASMASAETALAHLAAALIGFASLWLVARVYHARTGTHGLGLGDAKLFAAAGAWLGPFYLAPLLLVASVLALSTAGMLSLGGRPISWRSRIPFGPFLSLAFIGCWLVEISHGPVV